MCVQKLTVRERFISTGELYQIWLKLIDVVSVLDSDSLKHVFVDDNWHYSGRKT